jgi:phage tail-like protein
MESYPISCYFELKFDGEDIAFLEVGGLSNEMRTEVVIGAGENHTPRQAPVTNLVLKLGIVPRGSKLLKWCEQCIDGGLNAKIATKNFSIGLSDAEGKLLASWTIHQAFPIKYSINSLSSSDKSVKIETVEFAYSYFQVSYEAATR